MARRPRFQRWNAPGLRNLPTGSTDRSRVKSQKRLQGERAGEEKHTLSIPGGMAGWRNCAVYRQVALCPAPVAIDGSASGTVREAAQLRASAAMRTACTVPHSGLPPIGIPTRLHWEGAPWPSSR